MAIHDNYLAKIDASSQPGPVVVASTPGLFPFTIKSLFLVVDLRSEVKGSTNKTCRLLIRVKGFPYTVAAEISLTAKPSIYREDLLKYLTSSDDFVLAPESEIVIQLTGTPLIGGDSVGTIGDGSRPTE